MSIDLDSLKRMFSENQRRLRFGLAVLLCCLCIYFLFLTLRALIFPGPVVFAEINLPNQPRTSVRWNWYRTAEAPVQEEPQEEEELAIASINAELLGVVIAGEDSVATIALSRSDPKVFRVGEEIERNVSLEKVDPTRVVISQNGTRRQILLNNVTGEVTRDTTEQNSLIQVNNQPASAGGSFSIPGVGSTTPIQVPGQGMGLRLGQVSDEIADLADIQDGDVVLNINGTQVSELFSNPLLWQQFSQETNLPMTVMRDGDIEEVYVNASSLFERIIPQLGAGMIQ